MCPNAIRLTNDVSHAKFPTCDNGFANQGQSGHQQDHRVISAFGFPLRSKHLLQLVNSRLTNDVIAISWRVLQAESALQAFYAAHRHDQKLFVLPVAEIAFALG
jgi:hypothetical protein